MHCTMSVFLDKRYKTKFPRYDSLKISILNIHDYFEQTLSEPIEYAELSKVFAIKLTVMGIYTIFLYENSRYLQSCQAFFIRTHH